MQTRRLYAHPRERATGTEALLASPGQGTDLRHAGVRLEALSDRALNPSFAAPYERYADEAAGLAHLLTGYRRLAEDLMRDAFVRIARRLVHIREPDALWSYLRRSVVNLANPY